MLPPEQAYFMDGVEKDRVLEAGLSPFGPVATTSTRYRVPGFRPVKSAAGESLVTITGGPPPTGVAVKV